MLASHVGDAGSNPVRGIFENEFTSGCCVVWLTRLVWDQEIAGSNPVIPTTAKAVLMPWSADTDSNAEGGEDVVGII
jgi:hypothetical protein